MTKQNLTSSNGNVNLTVVATASEGMAPALAALKAKMESRKVRVTK